MHFTFIFFRFLVYIRWTQTIQIKRGSILLIVDLIITNDTFNYGEVVSINVYDKIHLMSFTFHDHDMIETKFGIKTFCDLCETFWANGYVWINTDIS